MAKAADVERRAGASIVAKDQDDATVAGKLAKLVDALGAGEKPVKWDTLRVSCETASVDPDYWQLRAGVHVA